MDYSEKIKNCRTQKGLSQTEIAAKAGISQAAYGKIESGFTKSISVDIAKGIVKALGVSFTEFFEIEDTKNELEILKTDIENLKITITDLEGRIKDKDLLVRMLEHEQGRKITDTFAFGKEFEIEHEKILKKCETLYELDPMISGKITEDIIAVVEKLLRKHYLQNFASPEENLRIQNAIMDGSLIPTFRKDSE